MLFSVTSMQAGEIRVDASRKIGAVRIIHGINGAPICYGGVVDLSPYHKTLGIPLTRIHDANWPAREAVDVHAILPHFGRRRRLTRQPTISPHGDYLKSILAVGSGLMYRLGESIEQTAREYYVHKPTDFDLSEIKRGISFTVPTVIVYEVAVVGY